MTNTEAHAPLSFPVVIRGRARLAVVVDFVRAAGVEGLNVELNVSQRGVFGAWRGAVVVRERAVVAAHIARGVDALLAN
jgi:hypothetical protein